MWVWVDWLGPTLLDLALAASVLLGLCALAMVGCRQPARRCSLARAAFLGSLALWPLVALGPGRPRIAVIGPVRTVIEPLFGPWPRQAPPTTGAATVAVAVLPIPGAGADGGGLWTTRTLAVAYLAFCLAGLAWLTLGWVCSCVLVGRARHPSAATRELYGSLPFAGWGWRKPKLWVSPRVGRPALVGVVRPTILLPPEFDLSEAPERLRLGLLHELAHAERGDAWFSLAGSLAQTAWFFLPWVWWMKRQMRLDQEFLADHRASRDFGPFGSYASSLVDLAHAGTASPAEGPPIPAPPPPARPAWGSGSALFQRVLMLIRCPYPVETHAPRWWRWSLLPLVACTTLLASTLTLRSAEMGQLPNSLAGEPGPPAAPHQFQLARLVVAEAPAGASGFTRPHDLPLALPAEFDLTLDLWAQPADLPHARIVGQRLGVPSANTPTDPQPAGWHTVEIHRDTCHLTVRVDGKDLPPDPTASPLPAWLSVQPAADRLGLFRNIHVNW